MIFTSLSPLMNLDCARPFILTVEGSLYTWCSKWCDLNPANQRWGLNVWVCVASSFQPSNSVYLRRCRTCRVGSLFNRSTLKYVHNLKYLSIYHSKNFNLYLCEPYFTYPTKFTYNFIEAIFWWRNVIITQPREIYRRMINRNALSMHIFTVNEGPALDFELCKHNSPPCKVIVQFWQFDKSFILPNGQIIDTFTQVRNEIYFICVLQQKCSLSLHLT
jgi:hypothetical protein